MKRLVALLLAGMLLLSGCRIIYDDPAAPEEKVGQIDHSNPPSLPAKQPASQKTEEGAQEEKEPSRENASSDATSPAGDKVEMPKTESPDKEGMTLAKAFSIAKTKAEPKNFDKALTDEQRQALRLYLAYENYQYLQAQLDGTISRFKESKTKTYALELQVFTTEEAIGKKLFSTAPFGTLSDRSRTLKSAQVKGNPYFYPRILSKEIANSSEYIQNLAVGTSLPDGRITATLTLGDKPLSQAECEELIDYFLSMRMVTWVELQYHVEEHNGSPTAIHRFWETEKELPFKEARAILLEKVQKRPNQQLSDRERMAFYTVMSTCTELYYKTGNSSENYLSISLYAAEEAKGMNLLKDFSLKNLGLDSAVAFIHESTEFSEYKSTDLSFRLLKEGAKKYTESQSIYGGFSYTAGFGLSNSMISSPSKGHLNGLIRHMLSLDCMTGLEVSAEDRGIPIGLVTYGRDVIKDYVYRGSNPEDAFTPHLDHQVTDEEAVAIAKKFIGTKADYYKLVYHKDGILRFERRIGKDDFILMGNIDIKMSADGAILSCIGESYTSNWRDDDLPEDLTREEVVGAVLYDYNNSSRKTKGLTSEIGPIRLYTENSRTGWDLKIPVYEKDQDGRIIKTHYYSYNLNGIFRPCKWLSTEKNA